MVWNSKTSDTTENCTKVIAEGNFLVWLSIFLLLTFNSAFGQVEESFVYDDKGRRDPFRPLLDEDGRYLLEADVVYSSDELNLSGILWDPRGRSSCLINEQIVRVGESIYGFTVKNMTKDSVTISKNGREFILRLSNEATTQPSKQEE